MGEIYEWIRGLICYLVFMTMILNLLPDRSYERYLRLFAGVVFLLLLFRPFVQVHGLEERMAGLFEQMNYQYDVSLLKKEIGEMGNRQMDRLTEEYLKRIKSNILQMANEKEILCRNVDVMVDVSAESETMGEILTIKLYLTEIEGGREKAMEHNRKITELKKQIGEYYGLEEYNITVVLEEGQG